jgi:hypothetical protein
MTDLLFYSSLIFITNMIYAFYKEYYVYSLFFGILIITSLIFHSKKYHPLYANIVDKIAIASVIIYGFYLFLMKLSPENILYSTLIILLFLSTGFLFLYGFMVNDYCFHTDPNVANKYHCLLHSLSCIGHHIIISL